MIDKLPPEYERKFSDLTHKLLLNINKLIDEHFKCVNEISTEPGICHGTVIYALSQMIGIIILELAEHVKDKLKKQDVIKSFQELACKALDEHIKVIMEIREDNQG